jgi:hypothetical protein
MNTMQELGTLILNIFNLRILIKRRMREWCKYLYVSYFDIINCIYTSITITRNCTGAMSLVSIQKFQILKVFLVQVRPLKLW